MSGEGDCGFACTVKNQAVPVVTFEEFTSSIRQLYTPPYGIAAAGGVKLVLFGLVGLGSWACQLRSTRYAPPRFAPESKRVSYR